MIVCNGIRFIAGYRCGVIENRSFCCALITDRVCADVWTFAGEWLSLLIKDADSYSGPRAGEPVAKALLDEALTGKQVRAIHDSFLEELDQCGTGGLDLGGAIEEVFGRARHKNIVIRYQNKARPLLALLARLEAGERVQNNETIRQRKD